MMVSLVKIFLLILDILNIIAISILITLLAAELRGI